MTQTFQKLITLKQIRLSFILQWNLNGYFTHLEKLKILITGCNPKVICLQETHFKNDSFHTLKGYNTFYKNRTYRGKASGGVATLISEDIPSKNITVISAIEAVAITIMHPVVINICNIYLPNDQEINEQQLSQLINQIPTPRILIGDFNAHNTIWGSTHTDRRGTVIEKFAENHDLLLLNTGEPTRFNSFNGNQSAIDLALSSPTLLPLLTWKTNEYLFGSDHFPIHIDIVLHTPQLPTRTSYNTWNTETANWTEYQNYISDNLHTLPSHTTTNIDSVVNSFTNLLLNSAERFIQKKNTPHHHNAVPWWSKECHEAIRESKQAFNKLKRHNTVENLLIFKELRARARYVIRRSKKQSWTKYVSTINSSTPISQVWKKVKAIKGLQTSCNIPYINHNDSIVTSSLEIAELFSDSFETNSSDSNYSEEFQRYKAATETNNPIQITEDISPINKPITIFELEESIGSLKNSSPGPDNIPNVFIKNLPQEAKTYLLAIYNKVWKSHHFPKAWLHSYIVPIPKPNKPKDERSSYRPISLTCSLCKVMEAIVNHRLLITLEQRNMLTNTQNGFRQGRSAVDNIIRLETEVHDSFQNNQKLIAVFFDIIKAFDMTWRYAILKRLQDWGFQGHLLAFIVNFLANRSFQARANGVLSQTKVIQNGIPQGSVISSTLFLVAINDVVEPIKSPVQVSLYADDLIVYLKGKILTSMEKLLQASINNLCIWSSRSGLRFSSDKTKCMVFTKRLTLTPPSLKLYESEIECRATLKVLGVTFDSHLTWKPHIIALKTTCVKILSLLKTLANHNWGADCKTLIHIYQNLIRSRIDYGSVAYSTASNSLLHTIDVIQNNALRIILGAYRTTPVDSLHCLAGELPLNLRRQQMTLTYALTIRAFPNHPNYKLCFPNRPPTTTSLTRYSRLPLHSRIQRVCTALSIQVPKTHQMLNYSYLPWEISKPVILKDLILLPKANTNPNLIKNTFNKILYDNLSDMKIYTDASKSKDGVGAAVITPTETKMYRLPQNCSVYTAELFAIAQAMHCAAECNLQDFIICTDSFSSLQTIESLYTRHPIANEIQHLILNKQRLTGTMKFIYTPSHVGIEGNESADKAAKKSITMIQPRNITGLPTLSDCKAYIKQKIKDQWDNNWKVSHSNIKLKAITQSVFHHLPVPSKRFEQVIINRLRLGHTRLTHQHLLRGEDPPMCEMCDVQQTVAHLLMECPFYATERTNCDIPDSLAAALSSSEALNKTLNFCKISGLISKL